MMQHQISLNKWIAARILHDVALHDVAVGARLNCTKFPRPSAHWHAEDVPTTGRQLLIGVPWNAAWVTAKIGLHVLPFQAIEGISLGSVRAIGRERSIAHLTIGL